MATIITFTGNTTVNNYHTYWLKSAVNFAHHVYKVHSDNGLLSDALGVVRYNELLAVNGVDPPPFDIPPPAHGPRPEPPPGANAAQLAATKAAADAWDYADKRRKTYLQAKLDLKQNLIASLPHTDTTDPAIAPHPILGYIRLEPIDFFNFMDRKYGTPSITAIRQNKADMTTIWNPATITIDAHIASLANAISMSALLFHIPLSEFEKCELLRASMVNAPAHLKKFIDDFDRDHDAFDQHVFQGPANDGLAPKLIAEAARVSSTLAGARGFGGNAAHDRGDERGDDFAGAAAHEHSGGSATAAENARLKKEVERLTSRIARIEMERNEGAIEKKCSTCKAPFKSHTKKHVDCKGCWLKNLPTRKGGGERGAGAEKK